MTQKESERDAIMKARDDGRNDAMVTDQKIMQ